MDYGRRTAAPRRVARHPLLPPRGVVTTRTDPEERPTIYDVIGPSRARLVASDVSISATSGLLILTTDTRLANRITDPASAIPRYFVTVRGRVAEEDAARLEAASVVVRKASGRETHLTVDFWRGRNREVRKLLEAIGHEVTKLKRVRFRRLGTWRTGCLAAGGIDANGSRSGVSAAI